MDLLTPTTVKSLAKSLTGADLTKCVQDVILWQDKGDLPDGPLRAFAARLVAEARMDAMSSLAQAEAAVLREAAIRFATMSTGLRADQQ
ncbi:hypothetical protein LPN04_31150 [Rugamonas sp. A1-17]|nr:hypothetical protein [Rugamonas sp. A1-17]